MQGKSQKIKKTGNNNLKNLFSVAKLTKKIEYVWFSSELFKRIFERMPNGYKKLKIRKQFGNAHVPIISENFSSLFLAQKWGIYLKGSDIWV